LVGTNLDAINTHLKINRRMVGTVQSLKTGESSVVQLSTNHNMAADEYGLVHGGFVFGLADYAAMVAVNEPNVVLGSANVKFQAPVKLGDSLTATAKVEGQSGKKRLVTVSVDVKGKRVLSGEFTCFILTSHVLEKEND
jgi:acyl-coenzyme A thioesterase PaaI-like protein